MKFEELDYVKREFAHANNQIRWINELLKREHEIFLTREFLEMSKKYNQRLRKECLIRLKLMMG